jgi:chemotaxis protein MotA
MFSIIGLVVVVASIVGGFTLAGGNLLALFHISEIIVIAGTALGTFLIANPPRVVFGTLGKLPRLFAAGGGKGLYLDALKLMFELFQIARRDGLVAIEGHIETPEKSDLFAKYPAIAKNHHGVEFFCDSLRLVLVGSVPPYDLEALMDAEIEVHHEAEAKPVAALQRVADALPGIGIVAAVLGIVITMGAIAGPIEQIGEHVAAALTGTFFGVLLAYGFVGPLSTALENANSSDARFYHFLKAGVVAFAKGFSPIVAAEFARRSIFAEERPSFAEMEAACKSVKGGAGATAQAKAA